MEWNGLVAGILLIATEMWLLATGTGDESWNHAHDVRPMDDFANEQRSSQNENFSTHRSRMCGLGLDCNRVADRLPRQRQKGST